MINNNPMRKDQIMYQKKIDLRWKGIFFILGGIVFLMQGLFFLNDKITEYLLLILVAIYYLAFARKWRVKQAEDNFQKIILRLIISFAGVLIGVFLIFLILVWIEQFTYISPPFLVAGANAIIGFVMFGWSFTATI